MNSLYYGDNLEILKRYVQDESVDLIYLDPPFNSSQNYNVLFKEKDGSQAASQIQAFKDTWTWGQDDEVIYAELVMSGGKVADVLQAFRTFLSPCDMLAYLVMMAPRLVEMRRILKSTGSIYLHCDPAASHYLKLLLDAVFGPTSFKSEIIWKRSSAHNDAKQGRKQHGRIHDVILFYTKSENWLWNNVYTPYDPEYVKDFYRHLEKNTGRLYQTDNLTAARPGGDTSYPWRVKRPNTDANWEADIENEYLNPKGGWEYHGAAPYKGRYWAYSRANMMEYAKKGRLYHTKNGIPRYIRYLDEMPGVSLQDIWSDIPPIGAQAAERLGYPTQKPEALLERIINASSNEGDVVLDPFCGCGTAVAVAQRLNRQWIGIDITHLAMTLMKERLKDTFGNDVEFEVIGEPTSLPDAVALANSDKYQFQWWTLGLVGARPVEEKKGADKGIDGKIVFQGEETGKFETVILSVKGGKLKATDVRDLRGVVEREKAAIGVLIAMESFTKPMQTEAVTAGFYESKLWGKKYPKLQLLTVADLLEGKQIDMPPVRQVGATFKKAKRQYDQKDTKKLQMNIKEFSAEYTANTSALELSDDEIGEE